MFGFLKVVQLKWRARIAHLYAFTEQVAYDRDTSLKARAFAWVLHLLSWVFGALVYLRHFLYKHYILRDRPIGCLVIAVGNLVAGGTGKTPTVERFASVLLKRGRSVAVITRGYGSPELPLLRRFSYFFKHGSPPPPKIVSDGKRILLDAEMGGDEAYMLARNLEGVVVLSCRDRVWASQYAIEHFGTDAIVLDDAFQYLRLRPQLKLLLIDKTAPFGNGYFLPRGTLRDPLREIKKASYIFLTQSDGKQDLDLESTIHRYKKDIHFIECRHSPLCWIGIPHEEKVGLKMLKGKRAAIFSGIAKPDSFKNLLESCGVQVCLRRDFNDHYFFSLEDLKAFFKLALEEKADTVIITEKDFARLKKEWFTSGFSPPLPFYYLRIEEEIVRGVKDFEAAVDRVCFDWRKK